MLLQTVKSRNLWLWGEKVTPTAETSEAQKIKADIQALGESKSKKINEWKVYSETHEDVDKTSLSYQENIGKLEANIQEKKSNLNNLSFDNVVNNVKYTRTYTTPFKITALQNIDINWDNPVGESYGIKTNFLQAWHNKPVLINFSGLSYIGAFGGKTVGDLAEESGTKAKNGGVLSSIKSTLSSTNSAVSNVTGKIQNFTNTIQDVANSDSAEYVKGKYYTVVDDDIYQINQLMSLYGEGMFNKANANVSSSSWIHLVLENEPGSDGSSQYAAFIGHIRNFKYQERVDKPFLYDFTCQFVGEPTISNKVANGKINAKQDANAIKLSVIASDSGYSLGYGF